MESGREVGREGRREAGREGGREEGKDGSENELIDECIAVCGSRNVIVVIAYADNDSKTVLLHLIRGPMTQMASSTNMKMNIAGFATSNCRFIA